MKIGILGGTFNPVHIGHLILAEEAREKLGLNRVIFVPANLAPHKDNQGVVSPQHRLKMLRLAIKGNRFFSVSDLEIKRGGISYTIDTLREFRRIFFKDELFFLIGSDLLNYLDSWKDLHDIFKIVSFVVATRPGFSLEKIPSFIQTLPIRAVDISAFEIRQRIRENRSFRYLLPDRVFDYINKKGLYR